MTDQLVLAILSAVAIGILGWLAVLSRAKVRVAFDRRRVYRWLCSNTRDEAGQSHVDTAILAKGTSLPDDRARRACMSDRRIFRFAGEPEMWSVWRQDPPSVYEKRGILTL